MTKFTGSVITAVAIAGAVLASPIGDRVFDAARSAAESDPALADDMPVNGSPTTEQVSVSLTPEILVVGASITETLAVEDAFAVFNANGLALPDLEVHFFDDEADCDNHYGVFRERFTPWQIHICSDLPFVIPHEIGHAWETANLTDDDRAEYAETRGFGNWDDYSTPWNERGEEDAAFILQQNLTAMHVSVESDRWQERTAAFELLTGLPSPLLSES